VAVFLNDILTGEWHRHTWFNFTHTRVVHWLPLPLLFLHQGHKFLLEHLGRFLLGRYLEYMPISERLGHQHQEGIRDHIVIWWTLKTYGDPWTSHGDMIMIS
jgi:hypothetical protein